MYFEECQDLNELKATYKRLTMRHHPDMGGDVRTMQEVNAEYDRMFLLLKAKQNTMANDDETGKTRKTTETPEEFRAVVAALLGLDGIEVELCGAWLWISGDTYANREALKACGCLWSRSNSAGTGATPRTTADGRAARRPWARFAASTAASDWTPDEGGRAGEVVGVSLSCRAVRRIDKVRLTASRHSR